MLESKVVETNSFAQLTTACYFLKYLFVVKETQALSNDINTIETHKMSSNY
jgi:hypothetical protein